MVSLVSLLIIRVRPYDIEPEIEYILNDVESGEENKLCVVIEAYSLNMGLEYLDDLFPILKKKRMKTCLYLDLNSVLTFAVPRARNSRTTRLPSFVCTISARIS